MAAKRGFVSSFPLVAMHAELAIGCKRNPRLAVDMYTKAGTAGCIASMHRMGVVEMNGELGVRRDLEKATKWFKRAVAGTWRLI